ncbi:DUF2911 domain-containing protein [Oleiharenicola lentus]|uniref:DUF2911 domain-containing protein n=1 Tax=Oleiharenicola lentus TaxID=2508720 RepID=UPI003F67D298
MKTPLVRSAFALLAASVFATGLLAQAPAAPKLEFPQASPAGTIKQRVGITDIEVNYSRPSMKGRTIFGGLEAWGKVWRTGANSATKITFSTPVKFGGSDVPAGSYALFTIPEKTEWTVILNKVTGQWGAYTYDEKNDVVRVKAKPVALPLPIETFTITFNHLKDSSALLELAWEKTLVPVKIEVDVVTSLVPQIEAAMTAADVKPGTYVQAAMFYYENNLDLKKAASWMDAAIAAQPKAYYLVYRKALILEKLGDKAGATATAQASLKAANEDTGAIKDEYVRLNETLLTRLK